MKEKTPKVAVRFKRHYLFKRLTIPDHNMEAVGKELTFPTVDGTHNCSVAACLVDYRTRGEPHCLLPKLRLAKWFRNHAGEGNLWTWKLAVTSKDSAYTTHKITTVKSIISLLCLQDTTIYTPLPEKGLSETRNHYPDELLICHFHRQLDSSSSISQTPAFPMCRQDKTLRTL